MTYTFNPGESSEYMRIIAAVDPPAARRATGALPEPDAGPLPEPRFRLRANVSQLTNKSNHNSIHYSSFGEVGRTDSG
jgi:hypothetical protein